MVGPVEGSNPVPHFHGNGDDIKQFNDALEQLREDAGNPGKIGNEERAKDIQDINSLSKKLVSEGKMKEEDRQTLMESITYRLNTNGTYYNPEKGPEGNGQDVKDLMAVLNDYKM